MRGHAERVLELEEQLRKYEELHIQLKDDKVGTCVAVTCVYTYA